MERKYIIVPDCYDYNRGDQALVWETIRLAQDSGFKGVFYVQGDDETCKQSVDFGCKTFRPLLPHPSRNKKTNNVHYGLSLLLKWGLVAAFDFVRSLYILLIANCPKLYWTLPDELRTTIELYKSSNGLFVKGGGFLQTFGKITDPYFTYYHIYSLLFANRIGLPIFVMPNSFGPLDGFLVKWQVKKALSMCKVIYCRESISFEYMKKTFPSIQFTLTKDLGFYLEKISNSKKYAFWSDKKNVVAITVRPYRFPEHKSGESALYKKYKDTICQFCTYLIDHDFYPVLIQHTLAVNAHEDDLTAIREIAINLPKEKYDIFINDTYNCQQLKSIYSNVDYIVGTRFHSVIFSNASKIPALSIAYGGNKSRGIMRDIEMEDFVIDIDKVSPGEMIEKFKMIISNRDSIIEGLSLLIENLNSERKKVIEQLKELN
ncbi:MAG: polysaccharide pyruvyl transferase family protein [Bacteroidales bacterium]